MPGQDRRAFGIAETPDPTGSAVLSPGGGGNTKTRGPRDPRAVMGLPGRGGVSRPASAQYESEETTSLPLRVTILRRTTTLVESLRKRTEPSPIRTLAPPGWYEKISSLAPALLPAVGAGKV